jgi:hypothetical protein
MGQQGRHAMTDAPIPYLEDLPADVPQFDFDIAGAALAELLIQETRGATVLGIHGGWGTGKTTLMYEVRDALLKALGEPLVVVIDFNAWKYEAREALWRALMLRVIGELRDREIAVGQLTELEDSMYRAFEVQQAGGWSVNWRTAGVEVASVALEVLQLGFAGRFLRRVVGRKDDDDTKGIIGQDDVTALAGVLERETVRRHVERVASIEQFLSLFRAVIGEFEKQGLKVVVLVDDLDRCLPESALEIFESIKLFMDAPGVGFVVAVDREIIKKGLAMRYAQREEAGRPMIDADEYIEKTIALSFDVPPLSTSDIEGLIATADPRFGVSASHHQLLMIGLGANPRRVKRFMNVLRVQLELAAQVQARGRAVPTALTAGASDDERGTLLKLLVLGYRYPSVEQIARSDAALLAELQSIATRYRAAIRRGSDDARTARAEAIGKLPSGLAGLRDDDRFWNFMVEGPDLAIQASRTHELLSWFRRFGVEDDQAGSSTAGSAPSAAS